MELVPEPSTNNRVVRTIGDGYSWADPDSAPIPLSACIPLPTSTVPGQVHHTAVISMPPVTPPPEEATSYLELWAGFVTGHALPNAPIRIFQARMYALVAGTVRIAVYRYGITQRILKANANTVDKNALHAFLVILATYQHNQPLLAGIRARVLQRTRGQPLNRWNQVHHFLNHPSSSTAAFGILRSWPRTETSSPGTSTHIGLLTNSWRYCFEFTPPTKPSNNSSRMPTSSCARKTPEDHWRATLPCRACPTIVASLSCSSRPCPL